jgi:uncharacterized protein (TIGR03118 family)
MTIAMKTIRILLAVCVCSIAATSLGKPHDHDRRGGHRANSFDWVNLVSDINGVARNTDENLVNPWGLAIAPNGAIWVANADSGVATVYDSQGDPLPNETNPLVVTIPTAPTNTEGGNPTGQVFNSTLDFVVSKEGRSGRAIFIFAAEDGTISGWNPMVDPTNAVLAADRSATGAIYKGLALGVIGGNSFLFATNFHAGTVDIFDKNFAFVAKPGAFQDPSLPAGFAPFGIQNIQNRLYVTYAMQDADAEDDVPGPGAGFVNVFDLQGNFLRRFASQGTLNAPWGLASTQEKFGKFENALFVGNFGDGRINVFNLKTGALLGQLEDSDDRPLAFDGLWALAFSGRSLFFTAGIADEEHGLFGVISRSKHDDDRSNDRDDDDDRGGGHRGGENGDQEDD